MKNYTDFFLNKLSTVLNFLYIFYNFTYENCNLIFKALHMELTYEVVLFYILYNSQVLVMTHPSSLLLFLHLFIYLLLLINAQYFSLLY